MKHLNLLISYFLFCTVSLSAQTGILSGIISDENSGDRIPFASVSVISESSRMVTGTISKGDGSFSIEDIKLGKYLVVIYFMGYKTDTISQVAINKQTARVNLGNIKLKPVSISLDEVQILANGKTSVNKIDRQTYKASDFETAKGGNATDLLSKIPSVSVDPDGSVSVRGTTDFVVYLNGKPTLMDPSILLGQISGSQVENVEIISIPTARFDAQGKGGIININTKRTGSEGLSISLNTLTGGGPWNNSGDRYSGYKLNDNRFGGGANLIYLKDKLTLSGGINYNNRNVNGRRVGDARILVEDNTYRHLLADGERPEGYEYLATNFGFDYQMSKGTGLSGSYYYGSRSEGRSAFYVYDIFFADKNKAPIPGVSYDKTWIFNPNKDTRYGQFQSGNIDFSHKFNKSEDIKISVLYEHSNLRRELHNQNFHFDESVNEVGALGLEYSQFDDTPLYGYRLSADYTKQMNNGSRLALGVQPQYLNISGDFQYDTLDVKKGVFSPNTELENGIHLRRDIYAAYADYSGKYRKLKYIAGLRMEYSDQSVRLQSAGYFSLFEGEKKSTYLDHRFDLFPSLHLESEVTGKDKITFAASRRISRPPAKNMAPFLYRRHLEVYEVGDPQLLPEYLQNAELSYDRKIGRNNLTLTGFYRGVDNAIFRVNTVTNENPAVFAITREDVLIRSYTNAGNTKSLGAELNANLDGGKYAKLFLGGSLYHYAVKGEIFGYPVNSSSLNWSLKSSATFNISKELKLAVDFSIKSASVTAQGQNDLFYAVNSSLSYTPLKMKGLDISLRVLDMLNSNNEGLDTRAFNKYGKEIFYQETTYFRQGSIVEFGLTYSFNKIGKNGSKADSTFGKEQF